MSRYSFKTTVDDVVKTLGSEIRGKNVIITGASPKALASKAARAIATKAAAEVTSYTEFFDALLNVAGVMATPYAKTADGIESQFAINHIGPFLLTNLILPKLNKNARIVNVSSRGYQLGSILWDDISFEKEPYNKWRAYAQSKVANILFSSALARRLAEKEIHSYSVHPGSVIQTGLGRHLTEEDLELLSGVPMELKSMQQGAANMVIAAFDPAISDHNGGHYDDDNQIKPIPEAYAYATGIDNEERLWELSEKLVGQKFAY
ncbi:hypothetical protein O988_03790 [Pseudogymnoascus sp. VKM F-3808]|nr:hypothetical protein O988_03790 [Pseudogymnoascus sp. VKM F-3808]